MFMPTFLMPTQVESLKRVLIDTFEYRLYTIKIRPAGATIVAEIYDGMRKVFETHGTDSEQALKEAKHWIDEQEEVAPAQDLHSVGARMTG